MSSFSPSRFSVTKTDCLSYGTARFPLTAPCRDSAAGPAVCRSPLLTLCPVAKELNQQPGTDAGSAFRNISLLAIAPVGAGDVQMGPDGLADKLAEKGRCCNGAAGSATGVLDVGDITLDQVIIVVPQRQLPRPFSRFLAGLFQLLDQGLVVAKDADGDVP